MRSDGQPIVYSPSCSGLCREETGDADLHLFQGDMRWPLGVVVGKYEPDGLELQMPVYWATYYCENNVG